MSPPDRPPDEPRFVELESKLAFQEETIDALNEVVTQQGRDLESFERRLALLETRLPAGGEGGDEPNPLEERPPHY